MARNGCEGCAQDEGYSARSRGVPFIKQLGWVIYRGEGHLFAGSALMGSGSKPQIHTSCQIDALLWVSSGLVLVAMPGIKNAIVHHTLMHSYFFKKNRGAHADNTAVIQDHTTTGYGHTETRYYSSDLVYLVYI